MVAHNTKIKTPKKMVKNPEKTGTNIYFWQQNACERFRYQCFGGFVVKSHADFQQTLGYRLLSGVLYT